VIAGSEDQEVQTTYNWSLGVQRDIGKGMILDVSYVANTLRNGYSTSWDFNAVAPYTTWNPTDGVNQMFRNPTSSSGLYSTNLIRSLVGFKGFQDMPMWNYMRSSNYNSLQVQLNRRTGNLQWNLNYTWSKTLRRQPDTARWVDGDLVTETQNRKHAANFNFGYAIPDAARYMNDNPVASTILRGWRVAGNGAIYSGTPWTVACSAQSAPAGYWTGTPTGGVPFRCEMGNDIWLPAGQYPSATEDPKLQWAINPANFQLPAADSLGIGNTPPTLFFGPGAFNLDLSLGREFALPGEGRALEFKIETFNTLNHMNPDIPSTGNRRLTYNFNTGAQTNASFGTISGTQVQARRTVLSMRIRF